MDGRIPARLHLARDDDARRGVEERARLTGFTRVLPAGHLGERLLALERPANALGAFEASQVREPHRFRGAYGAAPAAAQIGGRAKAKRYFAPLVEIAGHLDGLSWRRRARNLSSNANG